MKTKILLKDIFSLKFPKDILIGFGVLLFSTSIFAQKVATIGIDHSSGSSYVEGDGFSFVATQNIAGNDVIYFTNNFYDNTGGGKKFRHSSNTADDPNRFLAKYVAPAGGITKGTVVKFLETGTSTNVLGITCSSGSCGSVSLIQLLQSGLSTYHPITFTMANGNGNLLYAFEDNDDDPYNGVTMVHSVLYDGYSENFVATFGGNIPTGMNPTLNPANNFPNAIVIDGFTTALPNSTGPGIANYSTVDFKSSLRGGAVSKITLEDPSSYDYNPALSPETTLSSTAFSNLNLVTSNPTVSVAVSTNTVSENGVPNLVYTFTISAAQASNFTINFNVSGTAVFSSDYTVTGSSTFTTSTGSVVINSGNTLATVTLDPTGDAALEPNETVTLTVVSGVAYDAGSPSSASATITNDDTGTSLPLVALVGLSHADISINPSHLDGFSFVALDDIPVNTVVYFTKRLYDKDQLLFTSSFTSTVKWTAGSGANRGDVYVVTETGNDVFTVTCSDGSSCGTITNLDAGFTIPSTGVSMYAYKDNNDTPIDGVTEIYSALYTGNINSGTNGGAIPNISNPALIYPNAVVIDNFPNATPGRVEYKFPTERQVTVSRTLLTNTSNWLHGQSTATAPSTVPFSYIIVTSGVANPLVTVVASPTSLSENSGSGISFTFTLTQNAASNMTVNFAVGGNAIFNSDYTATGAASFTISSGSVVIPSGSNSAIVTINPTGDNSLEADESIVLTIDVGTGYDAGSPGNATANIINDDVFLTNSLVALVGMNHGNNTNIPTSQGPDGFSFVANQDMTSGTEIYFTDLDFNYPNLNFISGAEAVLKYTVSAAGISKGQVVFVNETSTNIYSVSCSAGSNCGTVSHISGDINFASGGDILYAYGDNDADPTNGVSVVYSTLNSQNASLSGGENPISVFPNAIVITGFASAAPDRLEYKFASNERNIAVNLADFQNLNNWLIGQSNQGLSVVPFANLNLCPASISVHPVNEILCENENATFSITASGASEYIWQVNSGSGFVDLSNSGIYSGVNTSTLSLTGVPIGNSTYTYRCIVNQCATSNSASLTVNSLPNASITPSPTPVCQNATLNLSAASGAATYVWSGNGIVLANANSTTAVPFTTGPQTYSLSVTSAQNCSASSSVSVTVSSLPSAPTSPIATPSIVCTSGTVSLSATGCTGTLSWFDASDNSSVTSSPMISVNKSYYAKCTVGSCVSDASSNVDVTVLTPLTVNPGNVDITWTGAFSNDWSQACNWNPAWVPTETNGKVIIPVTSNNPLISGTVATVKVIDIALSASLEISTTGVLNVRGNGGTDMGIKVEGALLNHGTLNLESATATAAEVCIYLNGSGNPNFENYGITNINSLTEAFEVGSAVGASILNASGTSEINIKNGIGFRINLPTDNLTLTNDALIKYTGSVLAFSFQGTVNVINTGKIEISSGTGIVNPLGSSITNQGCAEIIMQSGAYTNGGSTLNIGMIQMPNNYDFTNTGTFTNSGILKANSISGITNNKLVIENTCPIFTIGGTNDFVIDGIFTDASATSSAGVYTALGNIFVADNSLPAGSQTLYVKATQNDCGSICTKIVPFDFVNEIPTSVSISQTSICETSSVTLNATCASGTVTWYSSASSTVVLGTGDGLSLTPSVGIGYTYFAACETANCKSSRIETSNTLTVKAKPSAPTLTPPASLVVCSPNTLSISASCATGTVLWSDNSTVNPLVLSAVGTYTVSAKCVLDGCESDASADINGLEINAKPNAPTLTAPASLTVCSPNTLSISASCATGTVLWSDNSTVDPLVLSAVGTYTISAKCVLNGCESEASTSLTGLEIKPKPSAPTLTPPGSLLVCSPNTLSISASCASGTVLWSDNSTVDPLVLSAVGTYTVSAKCVLDGCESDASADVTGLEIGAIPDVPVVVNQDVCSGGNITLSTTCNSPSSNPVWFADNLGTVSVNPVLTNVTNTFTYYVACKGPSPTDCQSNLLPHILTVNTSISYPVMPSDFNYVFACQNGSAEMIINSSNITGSPLNFKWQIDQTGAGFSDISPSINYSGLDNDTLTISNISQGMEGYKYRVLISNVCNTIIGDTSTLKVNILPTIITQPIGQTVCVGNQTTLSVVANGSGLSYQWEVNTGSGFVNISNGVNYTQVNTPNLRITDIGNGFNNNIYRCKIFNSCISINSDPATLVVDPTITILGQPTNKTVCQNGTVSFNVVSVHLSSGAINYQWQVSTNGGITYVNVSNSSVYSGVQTNTLTLNNIPYYLNNAKFRCLMNNYCQSFGATLSVTPVVTITQNPSNVIICEGNFASFSVVAAGEGLTYRWQVNSGAGFTNIYDGGIYQGATSPNLLISGALSSDNGKLFRCVVSGSSSCDVTVKESLAGLLNVGTSAEALTILAASPLNTGNVIYQAVGYVLGINTISSPAVVEYRAGNAILLNPGFQVETGGIFSARIQNACINNVFAMPNNSIPKKITK